VYSLLWAGGDLKLRDADGQDSFRLRNENRPDSSIPRFRPFSLEANKCEGTCAYG
jgi:hypothetical protein